MGTVVSIAYRQEMTVHEANHYTAAVQAIFDHYDDEFSTYKPESMVSKINAASPVPVEFSDEAFRVFELAEKYRIATEGYFDIITPQGSTDPSGIVKAYAIQEAGEYLCSQQLSDWCINAGGDILTASKNIPWISGITSPSHPEEILSTINLSFPMNSLATSGFSQRGFHIWNPHGGMHSDTVQASVISDDIIFSDVLATALIAMGSEGLPWIEGHPHAEALLVQRDGEILVTAGYLELVA